MLFGNELNEPCKTVAPQNFEVSYSIATNATATYNSILVPKDIEGKNVKVTFEMANNVLDKIKIFKKSETGIWQPIKAVKFYYSAYSTYNKENWIH